MKRLVALLAFMTCALVCLTGCWGAAPTGEKFVGTWTIVSLSSEGISLDADDAERLRSLGIAMEMDVRDDGTFLLSLGDDLSDGSWKPSAEDAATFDFGDGKARARIEGDGTAILSSEDSEFVMARGEMPLGSMPSERGRGSTTGEVDVEVVDDSLITMRVTGKSVDVDGNPMIWFSIANHADKAIYVVDVEASVDGVECDPFMSTTLEADETLGEDYLVFDGDQVGVAELSEFKNIVIVMEVRDDRTAETLGSYSVTIP